MKIKGIGRIFFGCIILLLVLLCVKNILEEKSVPLSEIFSRFMPVQKNRVPRKKTGNHLEANILEKLTEFEVKPDEIINQFYLEHKRREIKSAIPRGRPIEWVIWQFYQCASGTPYTVKDCVYSMKKKVYTLSFTSDNPKKETIVLAISKAKHFMSNSAKIAILIEDFNFEANQVTIDFLSFPEPLTILLIPSAKKSSWTAQAADEYNKEIVIHMPFEPQKRKNNIPASSVIKIHYSEEKIRNILNSAIKSIPNFAGFANLDGHLVLEDSQAMGIVLHEIKKHHGYFIDTYGGTNSIVASSAKKENIPYKEVTAFIKNKNDISAIEEQLKHFAVVAQKKNNILISAKACQPFIKALNNVLPVFKQNGIRLVYVSEIVKHTNKN